MTYDQVDLNDGRLKDFKKSILRAFVKHVMNIFAVIPGVIKD